MHYKESFGRRAFYVFNYVFTISIALVCILPILHIFAISLSSENAVNSGIVRFLPVDFTLASYNYILKDPKFFTAMGVSFKRVILGVGLSMFFTILAAYPLSKSKLQFRARQLYVWFFMVTMMVGGGLIPSYLVISKLGLIDTIWALVLPTSVNAFYIILLQNYIKSLPDEIMESAFVDGAGHWITLWKIVLPLCKPVLATLVLFIAVAHWNAWFDGLIYMDKTVNYPLQSYLQTIVVEINMDIIQSIDDTLMNVTQKSSKSAQIFLAMLPIICVYPFLQKFFTKGIVMGSVKG